MADTSKDEESMTEPTPLWVKVFGAIALVVFVLFIALHLSGGGPGMHLRHGAPSSGP